VAPRRTDPFAPVAAIGRTLPDVELTTTWGKATLKVRGTMFVCLASHKSAEPDTLVVMMDIADRDALIEENPQVYYLKEHYLEYPCVLVRLRTVGADALRGLVIGAHRYVSAKKKRPAAAVTRSARRRTHATPGSGR
jgi:hypothetical protein